MRKSKTPVPPRIPAARAAAPAFMGQQGGNQHNWKPEKQENPRVSRVSGRAGPEKCYFWMWIVISWLVWVSVGGGAGLIKADDLAWASSCGIKDHDKQPLRQSRSHPRGHTAAAAGGAQPGALRTRLWVTSAEFPGHQGVIPIPPCTHKQRWTQKSSQHCGARGVLSRCGDTSHCVPTFWNLRLLRPPSKTLIQLLQKVTPGMQGRH